MDRSFVHGVKQQQDGQDYHAWGYHGGQQSGQQYHQQGQSPRGSKSPWRGQSPRKKSPRGGKGGGKNMDVQNYGPFQPFPAAPFQQQGFPVGPPLPPPAGPPPTWYPPFAPQGLPNPSLGMNLMPTAPVPQPVQSPVPQSFVPLAVPAPTLTQNAPPPGQSDLINYLQKRSVDLPPDVQQRIQTESRKQGKKVIKDLQASAKALGEARTAYEEALQARVQHVSQWKSFLAEAVRNWTDYAKMFEQNESALQARIAAARDQFQEAKECLDASKTSAGQVTEVAASDEEELPGDADSSAMQITTSIQTLSNSLQQLSKDAEAIQVEGPAAKRPRTEEVSAGEEAKQHFS